MERKPYPRSALIALVIVLSLAIVWWFLAYSPFSPTVMLASGSMLGINPLVAGAFLLWIVAQHRTYLAAMDETEEPRLVRSAVWRGALFGGILPPLQAAIMAFANPFTVGDIISNLMLTFVLLLLPGLVLWRSEFRYRPVSWLPVCGVALLLWIVAAFAVVIRGGQQADMVLQLPLLVPLWSIIYWPLFIPAGLFFGFVTGIALSAARIKPNAADPSS